MITRLLIILLTSVNLFGATYYVDPDSTSGGDGTTPALEGANRAYVSLAAAIAAKFTGKTLTEPLEIICDSNGALHTADTATLTIQGGTSSSANYVYIHTPLDHRHNGKYDTTKYRIEVSNAHVVDTWQADYLRIDGLQIKSTGAIADDKACIKLEGFSANNDPLMSVLKLKGDGSALVSVPADINTEPDTSEKSSKPEFVLFPFTEST